MIRMKSYLYVFVVVIVGEIYEGESDGDDTSVQGSNLPCGRRTRRDIADPVDDETRYILKHLYTVPGIQLAYNDNIHLCLRIFIFSSMADCGHRDRPLNGH